MPEPDPFASVPAEPYPYEFSLQDTALVIIDMQRDFVEPGGFGESLGNDVEQLRGVIPVLVGVLEKARRQGYSSSIPGRDTCRTCLTARRPS